MNKKDVLKKIVKLVEDFIEKRIDGKQYEKQFIIIWNERMKIKFNDEIDDIIDDMFGDVDRYESNPKLLRELIKEDEKMGIHDIYLNDVQLRKRANDKLRKLKSIMKKQNIFNTP